MSVPATRIGVVTFPTDARHGRTRHTCPRCGVTRQVNEGDPTRICGSCRDVVRDLNETETWT